jgi:protein-S-isoprenylcysteine O-methyltransferase Ste14
VNSEFGHVGNSCFWEVIRECFLNRYKKWAEREYTKKQRIVALFFAGMLLAVAVPFFLVVASPYIDRFLHLPRFVYGPINPTIAVLLIGAGWLFAMWAIKVQFSFAKGTPLPMMPTQKLVIRRPYTYCRNPMSLGTIILYLGIAVWIGSLSSVGLTLVFAALLMVYNKLIEERELVERFGREYLEYKKRAPFLIPRPWKGG